MNGIRLSCVSRKTLLQIFPIFLLPFASSAVDLTTIASNNQERYWYDGNIKKYIRTTTDEVAIIHNSSSPADKNSQLEMLRASEPGMSVLSESDNNITHLKVPDVSGANSLGNKIEELKQGQFIKTISPVFRQDNLSRENWQLLSGELIIHFRPEWNESEIVEWLDDRNLSVIEGFSFANNVYKVKQEDETRDSLEVANEIYESGDVKFSYPNWIKKRVSKVIPNDTLFNDQWHLINVGQSGGTPFEDINVVDIWDSYKGTSNEVIAIVDDGLEVNHEDLIQNIIPGLSFDFVDSDDDPTEGEHGTSVAGLVAARGNNTIGVSGVAPEAGIVGYRLLPITTEVSEASALSKSTQIVDIFNNSWGPIDSGFNLDGPGVLTKAAIENGVMTGRGGAGSIYVWSGGNGAEFNDNGNYDGYANSRYTIAVGATTDQGRKAIYSEPCACLIISAPSNGGTAGITTTDRTGADGYEASNYTSTFGGTSASAPIVSGVVALMLQANPGLTWRDVQKILAFSATQVDPVDNDWDTNGAGYLVNHQYGFGRVDAESAVSMAEHWLSAGPEIIIDKNSSPQLAIPDINSTGVSDSIQVQETLTIEYVEVTFSSTDHTFRGDLQVEIVSPDGTSSILAEPRFDPGPGYNQWTFGTARHLHELSEGSWTLKVSDQFSGDTGTFESWSLKIYGNNDSDGDGITNNVDSDDDNDGIPDQYELANGLDPFNGSDIKGDLDSDGYINIAEYLAGTDINNFNDFPSSSVPFLVKDINSINLSSFPAKFINTGTISYFIAQDTEFEESLWKTDGTTSGTVRIKPDFDYDRAANIDETVFFKRGRELWKIDNINHELQLLGICPIGNTNNTPLVVADNLIFYECVDHDIWVSDGTPEGTKFVYDSDLDLVNNSPSFFSARSFNGNLLFLNVTPDEGVEPWRSDGTPEGTSLIKDINPGTGSSNPENITVVGDKFYFSARNTTVGDGIWISDGSDTGTLLVKDISPDPGFLEPRFFTSFQDNHLFFTTGNATTSKLWITDGTETGTIILKDFTPVGADPRDFMVFAGKLFFTASYGVGRELWISDGTATGTHVLKDINPGSSSSPSLLTISGNTLFFVANDGTTGSELWKTDGTESGTVLVKDIKSGPNSSNIKNIIPMDGNLFFIADDGISGEELWVSDGMETGTVLLKDILPGNNNTLDLFAIVNDKLLFRSNDGFVGTELWISDGTTGGTLLLKDLRPETEGVFIRDIIAFSNAIYIHLDDELWRSDGSLDNAVQITSNLDDLDNKLVILNEELYYTADDNHQLYKINGDTNIPVLVKDFTNKISLEDSIVYKDMLFFEEIFSDILWVTDGNEAGTVQLNDFTNLTNPEFTVLNNILYFIAGDSATGTEIWKTDGTSSGTVPLKDINPGSASSIPLNLTVFNNSLYFSAMSGLSGTLYGLWKSDGTESGTVLIKEGNGPDFTSQNNLTIGGDVLYFTTTNALWRTDGTPVNTVKIMTVEVASGAEMVVYKGMLYFSGKDSRHGTELWRSNGMTYGTSLFKDLSNQFNLSDPSTPRDFLVVNGTLYFTAGFRRSSSDPRQLWSTDGTKENTVKLTSFMPGPVSHLTVLNNTLYFSAKTYTHGIELHAISLDADADGIADGSDNCPLDPDVLNVNTDNDALCNTLDTDDDNDGIPDSYEIANGLNLLVNDSFGDLDSDGLTNLEEYLLGTSVNNFDTDNDGMSDSYEVENLLDPFNDDSFGDRDSDGLTNIEEYILGTSANDPDTDHDGIDDKTEVENGSNPLSAETDLKITSTVDTQFPTPGSPVEFQVKVTNDGPLAATDIVVLDLLPKGMKIPVGMAPFVSQGTYDPDTGNWQIGSLLSGRTAILTVPAIPLQYQLQECFVNDAMITEFTANDLNEANNRAISAVYVGGVSSCAHLKYTVAPGIITVQECTGNNKFDLNVAIENAGPDNAQNVNVNFTGSYKSLPAFSVSPIIDQILPGEKFSTNVSLSVPCGQAPALADFTLAITSDTLTSTDSDMNVSGTFDVPDTGICSCSMPGPSTTDNPTSSDTSGGGGGGGCFIATAAYGSYLHPYVVELRSFRDNVLEKSFLGREFISLYYEYSPPLAYVIAGHKSMRILARLLLTPVVFIIAYPIIVLLILIVFALIFLLKLERSKVRLI